MKAKAEENSPVLDGLKWLVVIAIIAVGVVGNSLYAEEFGPFYRALALLGLALFAGGVAYFTAKGQEFVSLLKEARVEVRKVVWPTTTETNQSTLIVAVVVALMSLLLWGLDSLLALIITKLIG